MGRLCSRRGGACAAADILLVSLLKRQLCRSFASGKCMCAAHMQVCCTYVCVLQCATSMHAHAVAHGVGSACVAAGKPYAAAACQ
jgi:hypothetical protein